jgi:hypothetical protein
VKVGAGRRMMKKEERKGRSEDPDIYIMLEGMLLGES